MGVLTHTDQMAIYDTDFTCKMCSKPYKVFHNLKTHYRSIDFLFIVNFLSLTLVYQF